MKRPQPDTNSSVSGLAAYRKCAERARAAWPAFAAERRKRLQQGGGGQPVEKIAENILEGLFTTVLDWPMENVRPQVERADIVLARLGLKYLVLEFKAPAR